MCTTQGRQCIVSRELWVSVALHYHRAEGVLKAVVSGYVIEMDVRVHDVKRPNCFIQCTQEGCVVRCVTPSVDHDCAGWAADGIEKTSRVRGGASDGRVRTLPLLVSISLAFRVGALASLETHGYWP